MVSEDGFPKVLDFGLARPLGPIDPVSFRTQEGRVLGTLRYMAPEQIAGAETDARTDQYALGITAYELLAGTHPGAAIFDLQPKPINELAPDVPKDLALVVERMLARDPANRFASMDEVVHALEAVVSTTRVPPPFMTPSPFVAAAAASTATAETVSAEKIEIPMRPSAPGPSDDDAQQRQRLAALVASRDPLRPDAATLISKQAPSALANLGRSGPPPKDKTLPLAVISAPPPAPNASPMAPAGIRSAPPPRPSAPAPAVPYQIIVIVTVAVALAALLVGLFLVVFWNRPESDRSNPSTSSAPGMASPPMSIAEAPAPTASTPAHPLPISSVPHAKPKPTASYLGF
jgi:serine/threonine-protein kinase